MSNIKKSCSDSMQGLFGAPLHVYRSVSSTMAIARHLIFMQRAVHGMVLQAHHQSNGQGRRGAVWHAQADKHMLVSVLLHSPLLHSHKPLSLIVGLALCRAIETVFSSYAYIHSASVSIKWPNDIYINNKKCAGIIIEQVLGWYIVGIGVNVNETIPNQELADALISYIKKPIPVSEVLATVLSHVEQELSNNNWLPQMSKRLLFLGKEVMIFPEHMKHNMPLHETQAYARGILLAVDEDGAAVIENATGTQKIYSGILRAV